MPPTPPITDLPAEVDDTIGAECREALERYLMNVDPLKLVQFTFPVPDVVQRQVRDAWTASVSGEHGHALVYEFARRAQAVLAVPQRRWLLLRQLDGTVHDLNGVQLAALERFVERLPALEVVPVIDDSTENARNGGTIDPDGRFLPDVQRPTVDVSEPVCTCKPGDTASREACSVHGLF